MARLTRERNEALERETATSEVLKVISSSPGDLETIFRAMLANAVRLCEASFGMLFRFDGGAWGAVAMLGVPPAFAEFWQRGPQRAGSRTGLGRIAATRQSVHIVDAITEPGYAEGEPIFLAAAKLGGFRTAAGVPILKDENLIGAIFVYRQEVRPFTDKQIALVENFADQAVIAIENARLLNELRQRTDDLSESLEQQTATSEVLRVISSSPGELQPVFEAMLESAMRICEANFGGMFRLENGAVRMVTRLRVPERLSEFLQKHRKSFGPLHPWSRLIQSRQTLHIADYSNDRAYLERDPVAIAGVELGGIRTLLAVPMLKDEELVGFVTIFRQEVRPFADKQIELVSNFAKQAVIAIENARLLTETHEALERQTATAEVLQVINSSPGDLTPVFDTMLEKAMRLCEATFGGLTSYDGERFHTLASRGLPPEAVEVFREPWTAGPGSYHENLVRGAPLVHTDLAADDDAARWAHPQSRALMQIGGARTGLLIPLRKDETLLGSLWFYRKEVRPFTDKQIALLQNFAAQAVIAMENARLLGELRARTSELARSVDELTATSDVLKVISRSTVDLETVLDTLVETAARLCRADQTQMFRRQDDRYHVVASHGASPEFKEWLSRNPLSTTGRGTAIARAAAERRTVQIADVMADPEYTLQEGRRVGGYRTVLAVPLLRGDTEIGFFVLARIPVAPFTEKEIELATTFADQAVIAIENARLFEELRDRQAELRVTFDNMGDGVVMFDAAGRLTAWNRNFQELIELPESFLVGRPTRAEYFRYLADRGEFVSADLEAQLGRTVDDTGLQMRYERTRPDGRVIEVRRNPVPGGGFVLIYADITERKRAEEAIGAARDAAETALRDLQAAQDRLVQTQKLASLGQLTAGIAHEIKNPLNFVNNFSALSVELTDELNDVLKQATLADKIRAEVDELASLLKDNLGKVVQHGKRADSIVKNMLLHSREGAGERRLVDVNALVEESLNLAYHGARAEKQGFTIALERSFDPAAGEVEAFPQEITRVLLNLISNGFYAATKRQAREGGNGFEPTITAATKSLGDRVEIRIRDNGIGIPPEVREKMFNPFFTTKPTGEGTGLGLSISHDIIVKQHAGAIEVETEPGEFTELRIILPRLATSFH